MRFRRRPLRAWLAFCAGCALATLGATAAAADHHEAAAQPEAATPSAERPSDAVIRQQVQEALRRGEFVDDEGIVIETDEGVVTLRGQVAAEHERERAQELAARVDGVRSVRNELRVGKGLDAPDALPPVTAPGSGGPVLR